jgi:dTMP kinase
VKGKLIVIEGLDGSGKKTQTKLLHDHIKKINQNITYISFPDYDSLSSSLVKMYLNSEFGSDPAAVNAYAASSFFAVDRYASYKKKWSKLYQSGYIIIADRYTTSNPVYQMSKLPEEDWNKYLSWLYDYEYNKLKLPIPDKVIFLDVPTEISQELMEKRYLNSKKKKDLHENNIMFLEKCKKISRYVAKFDNWHTINCVSEGKIKNQKDIHKEILKVLPEDMFL